MQIANVVKCISQSSGKTDKIDARKLGYLARKLMIIAYAVLKSGRYYDPAKLVG